MSKVRTFVAGSALSAFVVSGAFAATAPFTKQQAEDGHTKFNNHCAQCHGPKLKGAQGPNLTDDAFKKRWAGKSLKDLRGFIYENMPQTAPKSLPDDQLDPIVAWILLNNGFEGGDKAFSKDTSDQFPSK